LDRAYSDFIRGNQQFATDINQALNFLGISTVTERPDTRLAGAIGGAQLGFNIAGLAAGGKGGSGGAGQLASRIQALQGGA
jgi:hypothetical protein